MTAKYDDRVSDQKHLFLLNLILARFLQRMLNQLDNQFWKRVLNELLDTVDCRPESIPLVALY